jgi:hypothetical protein
MRAEDAEGIECKKARERVLASLRWYGVERGFKPGWAARKFRAIYGCWPDGTQTIEADTVSGELMLWLLRDNARYSQKRRKIEGRTKAGAIRS